MGMWEKSLTPSQVNTPTIHDAETLMEGGITTQIRLDDQVYTLRKTRAGKLILTK